MTKGLEMLCRVVKRRLANGEKLSDILQDYPKLPEAERAMIEEVYGDTPNPVADAE